MGDEPVAVVVVLQRLGTGRLFACRRCGELARCEQCGQGEEEVGDQLSCPERHELRANFCRFCGATNLRKVRVGVTTLARDVAAQLSREVTELTSASASDMPLARVVVGTEAVWRRVRRCGVVIFADFDQYLLAPRESSRRSAVTAVGKAGRTVGPRSDPRGEVVLQTRRGDDAVIRSLERGNFDALIAEDVETAKVLDLPPYGALATVTGEGANAFVTSLTSPSISVHAVGQGFILRAKDVDALTLALRGAHRPPGRLRVAVE
jgi:primosomal protein N' (replication factor Y)